MSNSGSLAAAHHHHLPLTDNEWSQFGEWTSPGPVQVPQHSSNMLSKTHYTHRTTFSLRSGHAVHLNVSYVLSYQSDQIATRKTHKIIIAVLPSHVKCYSETQLQNTRYYDQQRLTDTMYERTLPAGCSTSLLCGAATASQASSSQPMFCKKRQDIFKCGFQNKSGKVQALGCWQNCSGAQKLK